MKKLLIFISLISVLNAESLFNKEELNKIALESSEKVWIPKEEVKEVKKEFKINLGIGLNTTHIRYEGNNDYDFYNDNRIITLELEKDKDLVGLSHFTNSFGNESMALYFGRVYDKNDKGFGVVTRTGIVKGYNRIEKLNSKTVKGMYWEFNMPNVLYKDYGLFATVGVQYKINNQVALSCDLMGNAVITSIKLSY